MPFDEPALAALVAKQEIAEVVYRYCRGIDRLDLDLVRSCYHPEAWDEHGSFAGPVDAYLAWVEPLLAGYESTFHFVGNLLVELDGDRARCETYGIAHHRGRADDPRHRHLITGFRFVDRFERRQGGPWRIARRRAITEWCRVDDPAHWWSVPDGFRRGRRDRHDPVYDPLEP